MRGKKSDPEFIAQFITESVQEGIATPDQIVQRAKDQIAEIDEAIRAIEDKKIRRSKLLDVVLNFEKITRDKTEEARLLPFFTLEYPDDCKYICTLLKVQPLPAHPSFEPKKIYAVKQLLERKIIMRENDKLVRGERFDEYMKFVYQEK